LALWDIGPDQRLWLPLAKATTIDSPKGVGGMDPVGIPKEGGGGWEWGRPATQDVFISDSRDATSPTGDPFGPLVPLGLPKSWWALS
jgi:hypothetical protein